MSPTDGLLWLNDEPLSRHTALRTGGACAHFVVPHSIQALEVAMARLGELSGTPLVLGAGTRTAFRDGAYDRAVIRLGSGFCFMRPEGDLLLVGAATPCPALAWAAAERGLGGLSELARTPGTLGAALACDEGAWRERVVEVLLWWRGAPRWRPAAEASGARLVLAARLALEVGDPARTLDATTRALRGQRALPRWYKDLRRGSPSDELGRVGAVGVRLRGASIPISAPEMIVNAGAGPAADLLLLHRSAVERVKRMRGVDLETSFTFLGRA